MFAFWIEKFCFTPWPSDIDKPYCLHSVNSYSSINSSTLHPLNVQSMKLFLPTMSLAQDTMNEYELTFHSDQLNKEELCATCQRLQRELTRVQEILSPSFLGPRCQVKTEFAGGAYWDIVTCLKQTSGKINNHLTTTFLPALRSVQIWSVNVPSTSVVERIKVVQFLRGVKEGKDSKPL